MYKLKKIVGINDFSAQFTKKKVSIIKRLVLTFMYSDKLHAWWSTQSWLTILISLESDAGGSDLRHFDGSDLKTYLKMRALGPIVVSLVRPTRVKLLDFFCSGIQFYVL